jgi:hypothetical protein
MVTIADAGNVMVPAFLALRAKGYRVSRTVANEGGLEFWHAERQSERYTAADTLALLGLVALYETRGDEWRAQDSEIDEFFKEFY